MMSEKRANLLSRMIKLYGYEHEVVVDFANHCESWEDNGWNDTVLEILVKTHEADPLGEDEDDD